MSPVVRWNPGELRALVWPDGVALLDSDVSLAVAERVWTSLHPAPSLSSFLDELAASIAIGLTRLPSFAVILPGADSVHVAVRGDLTITVEESDDVISGAQVTTWVEKRIAFPHKMRAFAAQRSAENLLPVSEGIVLVGSLHLQWNHVNNGSVSEPTTKRSSKIEDATPDKPARAPRWSDVYAGSSVSPRRLSEGSDDEGPDADRPAPQPSPRPYDRLLDESILVSIEDAALREAPKGAPQIPLAEPDQVDDADDDLHDGATVLDSEPQPVATALHVPASQAGAVVLATLCVQGHPNPPRRSTCYRCDSPVDGSSKRVSRPALGVLRCSSGEVIELTGPIVAGRSPSATARPGGDMARLLALPHPHISANHLELRLEDWTVLALDLHSRNGTYLRRSGQQPVRLPLTPLPLRTGDTLDFGHGVFLVLEQVP